MKIKMNPKARAVRAAIWAALAAVMAGSAMAVTASALNLSPSAAPAYLAAVVAGALCVLSARRPALSAALMAGVTLIYVTSHASSFGAIRALTALWAGEEADAAQAALGGRTLITCGAFALSALLFALLNRRELVSMAIVIQLSVVVCGHAMSNTASLTAAVPGLIASACAFALTGGIQRDLSALRVVLPAALALLLALALTPDGRVTWPPMERAAERVRGVFEQYFRFTHERIAFSINEEGYDRAGQVGDSLIAMLGGPANPHTDPVMRVETDRDTLMRGAIRTAYTGFSWVDGAPKNRYLYYDLTHRGIRDQVFWTGLMPSEGAEETEIAVEMLGEGTSTLFTPAQPVSFTMDLATAVYYNTAGEMFLTRSVQAGDRYSLTALQPVHGEALRQAVIRGQSAGDDRYQDILSAHTQLPPGIDGEVYALTMRLTEGTDNAYDRAMAIMTYLRGNMRYTLTPGYPPEGKDFVSHFVLDTREGYCSYYASAMAVMGRIAGLPTRYVEGYLARPGRQALTGQDAHAWAEVYFRGVGWVPFDATGGTTAGGGPSGGWDFGGGDSSLGGMDAPPSERGGDGAGNTPAPSLAPDEASPEPTATPEPERGDEAHPDDRDDQAPPESEDEQTPPEANEPPESLPGPATAPAGRRGGWVWVLLALLALAAAALAAFALRRRLHQSDPERLCAGERSAKGAAMIAYRANLTLLGHMGLTPTAGETPEAFARRVAQALQCPDYEAFAASVVNARYGRRPLTREDVAAGLRAYRRFKSAMGWRERLRYALTRIFRGLGDFESIP